MRPGESIRLIEGNAKSLRLKNNREMDFAAAVYLSETPIVLHVCLGVVQQFCRFSTWSHTECKSIAYIVSNITQHPLRPPHTVFIN
jgi:hypothetical protein